MPKDRWYVRIEELGEVLSVWARQHNLEHGHDRFAHRQTFHEGSIQVPAAQYLAHWCETSVDGVKVILKKDSHNRKMVKFELAEQLLMTTGETSALIDGRIQIYRRVYTGRGGGFKVTYAKLEEGVELCGEEVA